MAQPREPVGRPRQRAAGAPRTRLSGRVQPLAAALEEGAPRTVRRPRAEPGAAHDLRARGGDRGVRAARILDHRRGTRARGAEIPRQAHRVPAARRSSSSASPMRRRRARWNARCRRAAARRAHGALGRPQAAPPQSRTALHHLHPAAGSRAQARFQRAKDHARRAAAVRGRGHRRGRGRPHHLHAHRLAQPRAGGHRPDPRGHRPALRPGRPRRGAARLSHQVEERAGGARGDQADRRRRSCPPTSRRSWNPTSSGSTR